MFELAEVIEVGERIRLIRSPRLAFSSSGSTVASSSATGACPAYGPTRRTARCKPHSDGSETAPGNCNVSGGVAETASGQIVVSSPRNRWLTYLNSDLSPDTLVGIGDNAVVEVFPYGPDIVFWGIRPARTIHDVAMQDGYFHRLVDGRVVWTSWTTPIFGMPYWHGFGDVTGAVAGDSIFAMAELLYPATILNAAGDSVGTIGTPSPTFRRVPEIQPGAYGTTSPGGQDASDLLGTFDLVPRIDVVSGDYLIFTVGQLDETKPFFPFKVRHTRLEVYDRHIGVKLFEDVPLPQGVKVLGGGRYLYVLQNPDIPPWRIAKYRLRVAD